MIPLIAVDIGNSSTKLGWFPDCQTARGREGFSPRKLLPTPLPVPEQVRECATARPLPTEIVSGLPSGHAIWRVASVHREAEKLLEHWVQLNRPQDDFKILTYHDLPLEIRVDFPDRVGLDRLAAAVAAKFLRDPDAS
ncbi:MAG: type III pantothenate kinase, partial [Pirellulaceae bacterium]|nr:type III pantothenate kinase [Pirellulaceae bacterium]